MARSLSDKKQYLEDSDFGHILIRRNSRTRSIKASFAADGSIRLSAPNFAPLFVVRGAFASMKPELLAINRSRPSVRIHDGMPIGKSYTLIVRDGDSVTIKRSSNQLIVSAPRSMLTDTQTINLVREHMRTLIRREAKAFLGNRLAELSEKYGLTYKRVRYTHATSRWGSCSSSGTISLNIALMNLPYELIDYVLKHELAHTVHMNHSKDFWKEVERMDPSFEAHRKSIKTHDPTI